ncbi:MAG: tRNA (adenosine(37)-N6)-threonylcarbamoyltransferase complex ATPase subunit type 1 TsaE [Candidatus Paceibacterota bacterium]|jgi:tRNA threonylcarbamoyladenosine biosynthesis protein TsaE
MEFISKSTEETAQIASNFTKTILEKSDLAKSATVVGLYGELGSGKTTFMKYLAKAFGIEEIIQSPTFVIEKIYDLTPNPSPCEGEGRKKEEIFHKLIHIDAYRIETAGEMLNLGWSEIIADPQNLIFIEWPEKIQSIMPPHIVIKFEHGHKESERKIVINDVKK